jgi:antitoxin ParD1/3/4
MPKHTSITLGDHFQQFVDTRVQTGRFGSVSEVVRAALRLMEREEAEDLAKLKALRSAIDVGIDSGRAKDSSMESVLRKARARRA